MERIDISFKRLLDLSISGAGYSTEHLLKWKERIWKRAGDNEYLGHTAETMLVECVRSLIEMKSSPKSDRIQSRLMIVAYRLDRAPEGPFKVVYFPEDAIIRSALGSLRDKVIESEISIFTKMIDREALTDCLVDIIMDCSQRILTDQ